MFDYSKQNDTGLSGFNRNRTSTCDSYQECETTTVLTFSHINSCFFTFYISIITPHSKATSKFISADSLNSVSIPSIYSFTHASSSHTSTLIRPIITLTIIHSRPKSIHSRNTASIVLTNIRLNNATTPNHKRSVSNVF